MLFNSFAFLLFFPLVLIVNAQLQGRARALFVLAASYFFYAWWEPVYLVLILTTTASTFFCADWVAADIDVRKRKLALIAAIAINLFILGVFKYYNFFIDSAMALAGIYGQDWHFTALNVLLPVGISFYTFQCIGYVIDVWNDRDVHETSLLNYALYASYFPQLVAGPIERARHLLPQLRAPRRVDAEAAVSGVLIIAWGFFLKLTIADNCAPYVNTIFASPENYTGGHFIVATALFSWQIFCDFAGYSFIAIGCAQLMGIELMQNFRRPYFSRSIREFWSRWHISLSTWFRDYLYIPLGGNRVSQLLRYRNLLVVFLVSGLWHGANWTFVVWGGLHGLGLVVESFARDRRSPTPGKPGFLLRALQHLGLLLFVALTWVFFRASSVEQAWFILTNLTSGIQFSAGYLGSLLLPFSGDSTGVAKALILVACIGGMECVHFLQESRPRFFQAVAKRMDARLMAIVGLALITILLGEFSASNFIYFQF